MRVLPFKIPKPQHENLVLQIDEGSHFYAKLHQHEEIQISYIMSGSGKLLVSESINSFGPGDIIVIGGNTPHLFQSDPQETHQCKMHSLFFTRTSFGKDFFNLYELEALEPFFSSLHTGIKLANHTHNLHSIFTELPSMSRLKMLLSLLELLQVFSTSEVETLSGFKYKKAITNNEGQKMQTVFDYIFQNFDQDIHLDEVANLCFLTPNAFCRYFKQRTNKTFFQFVIELRIEHACQLLAQQSLMSVNEIAYQSGFKSITHFNRKFKLLKGVTPSSYVKGARSRQ